MLSLGFCLLDNRPPVYPISPAWAEPRLSFRILSTALPFLGPTLNLTDVSLEYCFRWVVVILYVQNFWQRPFVFYFAFSSWYLLSSRHQSVLGWLFKGIPDLRWQSIQRARQVSKSISCCKCMMEGRGHSGVLNQELSLDSGRGRKWTRKGKGFGRKSWAKDWKCVGGLIDTSRVRGAWTAADRKPPGQGWDPVRELPCWILAGMVLGWEELLT